MELRQLEYFVAVAEEANFTHAAARLNVAQPGVSAQIRRLERELGQTLLDRSERTVRVTEAGAAVLPHARAALEAVAAVTAVSDELSGLVRGHVTVGMVTACSSVDLTNLLASFHSQHPGVQIALTEDNSDVMVAAIRSGRLDLALIGLASATPPGIEIRVIADEVLLAAVRHDDALAKKSTMNFAELQKHTLISLPKGTGLRSAIDEALAAHGFTANIALEASNLNMVAQLAIRGMGIALLPESVAMAHATDLHSLAITQPQLRGRLALAWKAAEPTSSAARALIDHVATYMIETP
jgi:DNA-binding transcriptional LysR family regulator